MCPSRAVDNPGMTPFTFVVRRSERIECAHRIGKSTVNAGLKRVVCETCRQVNLGFVGQAVTGLGEEPLSARYPLNLISRLGLCPARVDPYP
jgi:hypothetical protein